jgi:cell volume regulation protein A
MLGEDAWISFVVRDHRLLPVRGESTLQAGDEVLVIASSDRHDSITALFTGSAPDGGRRP